jgi:hypothetical protein
MNALGLLLRVLYLLPEILGVSLVFLIDVKKVLQKWKNLRRA